MSSILTNLILVTAVFSSTLIEALPLQQDDEATNLFNLSEEEAYTLLKDSMTNENKAEEPSEDSLSRLYVLSDNVKPADKRKFSAWAGKRTEVGIPWGDILTANSGGGSKGTGIIRRGFNPWAGKRAFQPWAGKRSEDVVLEEKRGFKPWAGKRSDGVSDKRGFNPWAGKRSGPFANVGDTEDPLEEEMANYMEKRNNAFSPWKGKRNGPSGKRVFKPWAGK